MSHHNLQSDISKLFTVLALTLLLFVAISLAKPINEEEEEEQMPPVGQHMRERRSGIADQRLAELETLLALKRLRDQHRTRMPINAGYGLFDVAKIGRRRKREQHVRYLSDDDELMSDNHVSRRRVERPIRFANLFQN